LFIAPLAFLFNLQVNYTLTQMLCPGGKMLPLHIMTAFFLLAAAIGGFIAWRNWERAGRRWPNESGSKTMRSRFMGAVGLMLSALCFLGIVWQWIPQFIFNPCQR
jgi:protein-S-isoprenylcysteine O-methyltransferase Ste14